MDYPTNFAPAADSPVFSLSPRGTSGERGFYCSASYRFHSISGSPLPNPRSSRLPVRATKTPSRAHQAFSNHLE